MAYESKEARLRAAELAAGIGRVVFNPRSELEELRADELFAEILAELHATGKVNGKLFQEYATLPRLNFPASGAAEIQELVERIIGK